ncbi:MAG: transporter substrate-binding protein [Myxococcaceae bacterium]|nr:transporter substrate-binding protein [Myxococcaceae bacterium]
MSHDLPLSRRRVLLGALGAASAFSLSACAKAKPAAGERRADETLSQTPVSGGELLFAFDGASVPFTFDPHHSLFAPHHRIMRSIFDSLVVALPGHRFGPWLAKSWSIAEDGRSYTFQLRDDVRFHDGTRFDAQAVKVNFDRIADPKNALYSQIQLGPYAATTVLDDFAVRIELTAPYAPLLAHLSHSQLGIASPKALATFGNQVHAHPTGSGPFRFQSLQAGTEVVLTQNADYRWAPAGAARSGPALLQKLTFRNVPEEATRVAVLQSGQAGASDLIPPQNLLSFRKSPDFQVLEGELLNHNYSLFLNTDRAPWNDERARRAFRQALDLDAAVQTIYLGTTKRAWSPLSPSLLAYDPSLERSFRQDRAAAARTLDELGWKPGPDGVRQKDGQRLSLVFLDSQGNREKRLDLITLFRGHLRQVGIELRVESQPLGAWMSRVQAGEFDLLGASQFAADPDVLRRLYTPGGRARIAVCKVDDAELTRSLEQASEEGDLEKRAALYKQAQHRILDRDLSIPIYVLNYTVASSNRVQGIGIDAHGFPSFHAAWLKA